VLRDVCCLLCLPWVVCCVLCVVVFCGLLFAVCCVLCVVLLWGYTGAVWDDVLYLCSVAFYICRGVESHCKGRERHCKGRESRPLPLQYLPMFPLARSEQFLVDLLLNCKREMKGKLHRPTQSRLLARVTHWTTLGSYSAFYLCSGALYLCSGSLNTRRISVG